MRLSKWFARELARPVGACLVVAATWAFLDRTVLTQAPAQTPPAGGTAAPSAPPGGGRGGGRGALTPFAKEALAALRAPLDRLTPVTEAMLRHPPPGDWLHWRRTYDGWAHSPLTLINRDTVKDLKVAWTWSLASTPGAVNEFTPLVHDGVMFMWNFGEIIQALDAKTGTLLWQYTHELPSDYPSLPGFFRTKRSLAIGGNKLIVPTTDMRVIALDVKIGTKLWDVVTDDDKSLRTYNSGPLVGKDKVLVGAGNCSPGHANRPGGRAWWRHLEQPAQREAAVAPSGCVADDCGMRVRMSQANSSVCRSNARNRAGVSPIFLLQVSIIGR